jgi:hypothetical protein
LRLEIVSVFPLARIVQDDPVLRQDARIRACVDNLAGCRAHTFFKELSSLKFAMGVAF